MNPLWLFLVVPVSMALGAALFVLVVLCACDMADATAEKEEYGG